MTTNDDRHAERDPTDPGSRTAAPVRSDGVPGLVDWDLAGHRLLTSASWLLGAAVVGWVGVSVAGGQWRPGMLGNFVGLALVGMFLVEIWVVGGSALRGMLRAGEDGHRLSGTDVGLLPPQLRPGGSITPALVRAAEEATTAATDTSAADGGHDGKGPAPARAVGTESDRQVDLSGPRG